MSPLMGLIVGLVESKWGGKEGYQAPQLTG